MTVLVAVDGDNVPDRAVAVGYDLAQTYVDDLVALHVMTRERYEELTDRRPDFYLDAAADEAAETAGSIVEETVGPSEQWTSRGRVGNPTEEIIQAAEQFDARYIVISGRKRTPVGKAIFGSTTQSVLLQAERPVVTVLEESE